MTKNVSKRDRGRGVLGVSYFIRIFGWSFSGGAYFFFTMRVEFFLCVVINAFIYIIVEY